MMSNRIMYIIKLEIFMHLLKQTQFLLKLKIES